MHVKYEQAPLAYAPLSCIATRTIMEAVDTTAVYAQRRHSSEELRIFEGYGFEHEPNGGTSVVAFDAEESATR
jgi:hypothetical protein